jgi:hypothetical protein
VIYYVTYLILIASDSLLFFVVCRVDNPFYTASTRPETSFIYSTLKTHNTFWFANISLLYLHSLHFIPLLHFKWEDWKKRLLITFSCSIKFWFWISWYITLLDGLHKAQTVTQYFVSLSCMLLNVDVGAIDRIMLWGFKFGTVAPRGRPRARPRAMCWGRCRRGRPSCCDGPAGLYHWEIFEIVHVKPASWCLFFTLAQKIWWARLVQGQADAAWPSTSLT